jgi:hypothetical protein
MTNLGSVEIPEGVDSGKANRLIKWILELEDENDKTKKYGDSEIIQKIGKEIQGDIKCI